MARCSPIKPLSPVQACENRVGDQSILNYYYARRWAVLPSWLRVRPAGLWLNELRLGGTGAAGGMADVEASRSSSPVSSPVGSPAEKLATTRPPPALLHFLSEPKPWFDSDRSSAHSQHELRALWAHRCPEVAHYQAGVAATAGHAHGARAPAPAAQAAASQGHTEEWMKAVPPALHGKEGQPCDEPCNTTTAGKPCDAFCGAGWLCCRRDYPSPGDACRKPLSELRALFVRLAPPRGWICVNPSRPPPACLDARVVSAVHD